MSELWRPQVLRSLTRPGDFPLPALVVASAPPAAPTPNMPWLDSATGRSFLWHANAQWVEFPLSELSEMPAPRLDPVRRPPRPSLLSRMKQAWQAARAAGIEVAITVEGDKLTATPVDAKKIDAPGDETDTPEQLRRLI